MNLNNIRRNFSRVTLTIAGIGILIGLLLIALPVVLFDIAGVGLIVLSILYVFWSYRLVKKSQNITGSRIFVDEDGNGTIDAIYVDTDGNGEADTATTYRKKK